VGQSPGQLIVHLWMHNMDYLEYIEKKTALDAAASNTLLSNPFSISSFVPQLLPSKDLFKQKNAQWVVEKSMPLSDGESPALLI
jgi:hypothetical protein